MTTTVQTATLLRTVDLVREFRRGGKVVRAVDEVNLHVERHELVAIRGRSGSGKTTLLNMLGGLDRPTSGSVHLDGRELSSLPEAEVVAMRRERIAYIFQAFGLLPVLSAAENIEVPLRLVKTEPRERDARVAELLELVGLGGRASHRPHELSGGEQQRVAIARALANDPDLLLADEPTGQLDSRTGATIMGVLRRLVDERGLSIVVATHDPSLLDLADRVVEMSDGRASEGGGDVPAPSPPEPDPQPDPGPPTVQRRPDPVPPATPSRGGDSDAPFRPPG